MIKFARKAVEFYVNASNFPTYHYKDNNYGYSYGNSDGCDYCETYTDKEVPDPYYDPYTDTSYLGTLA